jgi:hypothetical protein
VVRLAAQVVIARYFDEYNHHRSHHGPEDADPDSVRPGRVSQEVNRSQGA